MTIQSIMNMSPQDIERMDTQSLRKVTTQIKSAANKRLAKIEAMGKDAEDIPAYKQFRQAHSYANRFDSTVGKSPTELRSMLYELQTFMGYKTSTSRGWKSYQKAIYAGAGKTLSGTTAKHFWEQYNKFKEAHAELVAQFGSYQTQKMIYESRMTKLKGKEAWKDVEEKMRAMQRSNMADLEGTWKIKKGIRIFYDKNGKPRIGIDSEGKRIFVDNDWENEEFDSDDIDEE